MKVTVIYDSGEVFETITPAEVKKEMLDDMEELMTSDNKRVITDAEVYSEMEDWVISSMRTAVRNEKGGK